MALPIRSDDMVFRVLKAMGYSAVGVGLSEKGEALDRYLKAARKAEVKIVHVDTQDRKGTAPYVIKEVAGVRVGIVSFGYIEDDNTGAKAQEKRFQAYEKARAKCDILVLMNGGSVMDDDLLTTLTTKYGAPEVVIGGSYASNLYGNGKIIGKTHILPPTLEGKHVGLLDIMIEPGKDPQMNCSDAILEESMAQDPNIQKEVEAYLAAEPKAPDSPANKPVGAYYISKTCEDCHKSEYDDWATSKHAQAVNTLINEKHDVPLCLPCHSEKYRQTNEYLPINESFKRGVECASCHIKVLPHGPDGPSKDITGARIDLDTCRVCHTKERSPEFEPKSKEYWQKASHKPKAVATD